jgi:hypothetical protein
MHLFWNCPFASKCWNFVCPTRTKNLVLLDAVSDIKDKLRVPLFMEIIILASWSIWLIKNKKILENIRPTFSTSKAIFHQKLRLVGFRIKKKFETDFKDWINILA